MFSSILLTHRIIVSLFLLHYVVKLTLLLLDKKDALASYSKATRVLEMIVSLAFLLTGGWMLYAGGSFGSLMVVKLICVFASIPLAIIGFKRSNKLLASLAIILLFAAYGLAEMSKKQMAGGKVDTSAVAADPIAAGKLVFEQSNCATCHGADGKAGLNGAKDLSVTMLSMDQQKEIIKNGKNAMPGNSNLTDEQLNDLVQYIGTLRK
ncbi:MAG TPA: cytochrome c [Chitinophagales bacterium]|nr:cytochrome c [Chitinophagales bacterium]